MSGVARSPADVSSYAACTLLSASLAAEHEESGGHSAIDDCIQFLKDNEFISLQNTQNPGIISINDHKVLLYPSGMQKIT